jgi:hypothetical protein
VKKVVREVGTLGWPHFTVEGAGAGGERTGEMKEFANVQIEVGLQPTATQALLARVESELFPRYGMIAFDSDVHVMRSEEVLNPPLVNSRPERAGSAFNSLIWPSVSGARVNADRQIVEQARL